MAMNKKETAALKQAVADLDEARRLLPALRWPTDPLPTPIDKKAVWKTKEGEPWERRYATGWAAAWRSGEAKALRMWSESIRHGYGTGPREHGPASQGEGPDLYATRLEALIVARFNLARECALALSQVDTRIEQERATPTDFNAPISQITGE